MGENKVVSFGKKHGGQLAFLLAALVLFAFFGVQAIGQSSFEISAGQAAGTLEMQAGQSYTAQLPSFAKKGALTALQVPIRYMGDAPAQLKARLTGDGQEIAAWQVALAPGQTEAALPLPAAARGTAAYALTLEWTGDERASARMEQTVEGAPCVTLRLTNARLRYAALLAGAALTACLAVCLWLRVNRTAVMAGILLVLAAAYSLAFPPGQTPDEQNHFLRAYEVATGGLISRHMEPDGVGGNVLPAALKRFHDPAAVIDDADSETMRYGNTALYSPVSYLPQALGIRAALLFTHRTQTVFYAGRAANALIGVVLYALALQMIPFGKELLFLVLAFPVTGQEIGSMSPDGFTIAVSALFIALALRLAYTDAPIKRGFIALCVLGAVVSQCKIVYIVLLLLVLLIPNARFGGKKQAWLCKGGLLAGAAVLNLAWLAVSAGYLVEFNPGVSSMEQAKYVLTHIPSYALVCLRTAYSNLVVWIECSIAQNMGPLTVPVQRLVPLGFYTLTLYALLNTSCGARRLDLRAGLVLGGTFLLGAALIFTSLYVQWTPLRSKMIDGIQGRYFTPLYMALFALILLLRAPKTEGRKQGAMGAYMCLGALLLNGIALMDIIHYYA